jgi:hypothetical protein
MLALQGHALSKTCIRLFRAAVLMEIIAQLRLSWKVAQDETYILHKICITVPRTQTPLGDLSCCVTLEAGI